MEFVQTIQEQMEKMSNLAHVAQEINKDKAKLWYDHDARQTPLQVGDEELVLLPEDNP